MRVIRTHLGSATLHNVRYVEDSAIYDLNDYGETQQIGDELKNTKSFGVYYQGVRAEDGCIGVMRPKVLSDAIHWRYLRYHYEAGAIVKVESLDGSGRR